MSAELVCRAIRHNHNNFSRLAANIIQIFLQINATPLQIIYSYRACAHTKIQILKKFNQLSLALCCTDLLLILYSYHCKEPTTREDMDISRGVRQSKRGQNAQEKNIQVVVRCRYVGHYVGARATSTCNLYMF